MNPQTPFDPTTPQQTNPQSAPSVVGPSVDGASQAPAAVQPIPSTTAVFSCPASYVKFAFAWGIKRGTIDVYADRLSIRDHRSRPLLDVAFRDVVHISYAGGLYKRSRNMLQIQTTSASYRVATYTYLPGWATILMILIAIASFRIFPLLIFVFVAYVSYRTQVVGKKNGLRLLAVLRTYVPVSV
jgi:hypothetical protein